MTTKKLLPWLILTVDMLFSIVMVILFVSYQPNTLEEVACGLGDQSACNTFQQQYQLHQFVALLMVFSFLAAGILLVWGLFEATRPQQYPYFQPPQPWPPAANWQVPPPTSWPAQPPTNWPAQPPTNWPVQQPMNWSAPPPTAWPAPAPTNWSAPPPTAWSAPPPIANDLPNEVSDQQ